MLITINLLSILVLPNPSLQWPCSLRSDVHYTMEDNVRCAPISVPISYLNVQLYQASSQFEVGKCHRRIFLTFCFALFQLGVRNYHSSLCFFKDIHSIFLIGHVRPFCALATRLVREEKTIVATFVIPPDLLDKTRTEVSRQFLDEPSGSSKALQRIR